MTNTTASLARRIRNIQFDEFMILVMLSALIGIAIFAALHPEVC